MARIARQGDPPGQIESDDDAWIAFLVPPARAYDSCWDEKHHYAPQGPPGPSQTWSETAPASPTERFGSPGRRSITI
jgi:hypothetical protein